jgi:class 3 adenylate cyclase
MPLPPHNVREPDETIEQGRRGTPSLSYRDAGGTPHVYALEQQHAVTIGRSSEVDVSLPWDLSVSLVHAEVVRLGSQWLISDDGVSRNGTFVNGERVSGRCRLQHGDIVRLGRTELTFQHAARERRGTTTISDGIREIRTVSVLFTDLVRSTELFDRVGDEAGDRLLHDHFAILRDSAREHGGKEVKSLGDGLMLVFTSVAAALGCALTMQQRLQGHDRAEVMGLRIGVNAGEAIEVDGDYFGRSIVIAKRLCDHASAKEILVSDAVRSLLGPTSDYRFCGLGAVRLKGLTEPVTTFRLDW